MRAGVGLAWALTLVIVFPSAVGAGLDAEADSTSGSVSKSGEVVVVASSGGGSSSSGGSWGGSSPFDACQFFSGLGSEDLLAFAGPFGLSGDVIAEYLADPPESGWSVGICPEPILGFARYAFWPTGSPVPRQVVEAAIAQAVDRVQIPFPEPQLAPPASAEAPAITQLATWVWPGSAWSPVSASAVAGPVQVTATATPVGIVVDPGDGSPVFGCDAPTPYVGQADAFGACVHTYTQTTMGVPYGLAVSVIWEFSYTCSGSPGCADVVTIEPFTATQQRSVWVAQIRPVITS